MDRHAYGLLQRPAVLRLQEENIQNCIIESTHFTDWYNCFYATAKPQTVAESLYLYLNLM